LTEARKGKKWEARAPNPTPSAEVLSQKTTLLLYQGKEQKGTDYG